MVESNVCLVLYLFQEQTDRLSKSNRYFLVQASLGVLYHEKKRVYISVSVLAKMSLEISAYRISAKI